MPLLRFPRTAYMNRIDRLVDDLERWQRVYNHKDPSVEPELETVRQDRAVRIAEARFSLNQAMAQLSFIRS